MPGRLTDRLGVGRIVLVRLHVRLHELRRHQLHLMSQLAELPRPVVGTSTGFQAHQTRWQIGEIGQNLFANQRLTDDFLASGVHTEDMKGILGNIKTDGGHVHGGCSSDRSGFCHPHSGASTP